ncbi:Uu.00g037880.m01.CDS01 [Anthostomella pinea]|uniref:Mediator of RNA polymerase II transcription subunit 14 n=1 Tax=Anthostomella pinea TaxID=933095 RepID=A0AAI8VAP6_9PEZI|nr:Uu.00g037880.m01.CDS01 [Anthostomella pinea]
MPGVVMMENGTRDTPSTNHDRHNGQLANGQNGLVSKTTDGSDGGANVMVNGNSSGNGNGPANANTNMAATSRINDLPEEIQHITQGYMPLGVLLSRLAQNTHNQLVDEIAALAKMPVSAPTVNSNSAHPDGVDDTSPENLAKKVRLLNFVQERHGEWVKALVISNWSRRAEPVSKLIDLMHHINTQRKIYDDSLDYMINIKRDLTYARLPNPDLRTALQVLSTGHAPWMPDINYIEPPPLTPKEQLHWVENLNTLLSLRLNLEDHENIPDHFQDYDIDSGRVTFKVAGEFEVDLTIADEDFEKQFWFIDFRFAFTPAPTELSESLRMYLENKVNEMLEKDGLYGCFKFLHEFVLTHKITEYVRQALELSKGRWVDTLKVERLNRAMSIQYWANRYPPDGPRSWIILGVHSGRKPGSLANEKSSSHLVLRWFRDNKEVKDVTLPIDSASISTEDLLNRVIGTHIESILGAIHDRLKPHGRFTKREAGLTLRTSRDNPIESALEVQLCDTQYQSLQISPITGLLVMKPQSNISRIGEQKLNWGTRDPIQEGVNCLESVRCHFAVDELNRRGRSIGWAMCRSPVKPEDVKALLQTKQHAHNQAIWLQRQGWPENWYLMVSMSLGGDRWWLIETMSHPTGPRVLSCTSLPLSCGTPKLSDKFFANITAFTAAVISQATDLRALHQQKIEHKAHGGINRSLPANMKVPTVFIRLSDMLGAQPHGSTRKVPSWALDFVQVMFTGMSHRISKLQSKLQESGGGIEGSAELARERHLMKTLVDARLKVAHAAQFGLLKGIVERDMAFNERLGVFAFRLEAPLGSSILDTLIHRVQALARLADCIEAIRRSDRDIQCEEITLSKVVFSYSGRLKSSSDAVAPQKGHRWKATLDLGTDKIKLLLEQCNPQLRVLDLFQKMLNSDLRFRKLPFFLSGLLPLQEALDSVEDAWQGLTMNDQGRVEIFSAHLDWLNVHYVVPGANRNTPRCLTMQIRLKERRGDVRWHIFREERGPMKNPDDEFKKILQKVWAAENGGWQYLGDSAAVEPDGRVGELVKAIDEAVRPLATRSPSVMKQSQAKAPPAKSHNQNQNHNKTMASNKGRQQQGAVVINIDD